MRLVETIQELNTEPRHESDEYEYTSDFLEWFFYNIYKERIDNYPVIRSMSLEPEYNSMLELCTKLINVNNAKKFDDATLMYNYENMKQWTIDVINKYN